MSWLSNLKLKSPYPRHRQTALDSLAGSPNASDTERIVASLEDESPQVRCAAVRALERAPLHYAMASLKGALRDEDFQVRETAARVLGRLGDAAAIPPLMATLKDADPAVRASAAGALRTLGWKPATKEELVRFDIALGNTPPPISVEEVGFDGYGPKSRFDTTFQRRAAAEALKELNDPRKIRLLLNDLDDSDPGIRIAAIHSLARATSEEVPAKLLGLFRDQDADVRLNAIQILSKRSDAAPTHFIGLLNDANSEVRVAAVEFLGRIPHPQIAEVLHPLLSDADSSVREATEKALNCLSKA